MGIRAKESTIRRASLVCSICGQPININDFDLHQHLPKMMLAEHLCYQCAFWIDKARNPDPNREIIEGNHYIFKPFKEEKTYFMGMRGHKLYIMKTDGTVKCSNDVWHQGEIPERFRSIFPDTAKFIPWNLYCRLSSRQWFKCQRKGCYDRYHCYWYHPELTEPNGEAWNQIPNDWKIGGELCPNFVNRDI